MKLMVNIDVDDVGKAVRFYGKAPGSRAAGSISQSRDYLRHWTPVHLDFAVKDIAGATKRALAAGAAQEGEIERHAWGDIAHLADPFGHGFCLIEFRGRGYDEIATDESGKPIVRQD